VNILARFISFVFHPLLMATYLIGMLAFLLPSALYPIDEGRHIPILIFIFALTFALPALGISTLRILGAVKTFAMKDRGDRIRPFFLITITYCFVTYMLSSKTGISTHDNFFKLLLIIDCIVITATVITFFYKISIHSMGIWGVLGIAVALNRMSETDMLVMPVVACLVIAGLIMWARLLLETHSSKEVWLGALVGFSIGLTGVVFLF
jgi:hypothetical protein